MAGGLDGARGRLGFSVISVGLLAGAAAVSGFATGLDSVLRAGLGAAAFLGAGFAFGAAGFAAFA